MYGTALKLGAQVVPHLLKAGGTAAGLGGAAYLGGTIAAGGAKLLGADGYLDNLYRNQLEEDSGVFKPKGFTAQILKPFVEEKKIESARLKQARDELLVSLDENPADYPFTSDTTLTQAQGQVLGNRRDRQAEERRRQEALAMKPYELQMAEAAATRADAQLARADELALRRQELMRQDQRYNERLDREERTRRQEAVMAMMGGLTSLGAAFAL